MRKPNPKELAQELYGVMDTIQHDWTYPEHISVLDSAAKFDLALRLKACRAEMDGLLRLLEDDHA